MMTGMQIRMTSPEAIGIDDWNALAATNSVHTIFQCYDWNTAWWQVHGPEHEIALIEARDTGRLVGIAPLVIDRAGVLRFFGYGSSDYLDLLIENGRDDVMEALTRAILSLSWNSMVLEHVHQDSLLVTSGWAVPSHVEFQQPAPSFRFNHDDTDLQLVNKKSLKRHHNYFQRSGALSFEVLRQADEVIPHLEQFFEQHIARRALTDKPSKFSDARELFFYQTLTENMSRSGYLRFSVLRFNDDVLAYHFGFEFNGILYWYKPTFNVSYKKHSPGEVLLKLIIQDCIDRDLDELDFTIGKEAFKYRFANQERVVYRVFGFRTQARCVLHRELRQLGKRLRAMGKTIRAH